MPNSSLTMACCEVLAAWELAEDHAARLLGSADGLALLALLCNAAAKSNPNLYRFKALLVTAACRATTRDRWWADQHCYALATPWDWFNRFNRWWESRFGWYISATEMLSIFIETGLVLDGDTLQFAFHFRPGDELPDVGNAPAAKGRTWRGQRAQANAARIAAAWLGL